MTKRYYIIFSVISLIIVIITTSIKLSKNKMATAAGGTYTVNNIDQLISDSPLIIVGDVGEEKETIKEDGVKYKVSQINVVEILKGDIMVNSDGIKLMQMDIPQDPAVEKGKRVLLFLKQYKSKNFQDGYICVGLGQGCYVIENKKLKPSSSISNSLKNSIEDQKDVLEYIKLKAAVGLK
ncbi:MAG: hypothetical protein GX895_12755 [Clostridiales bacterium]|uniref:hypothetical protein n=1 Tax=Clostridium sp. N3C TaxID=1776758 RepID=UPI00092E0F9E|nr:hypothetical protein [Clostridium sp. N3C]NLZ49620.1 hypothetical protein [Clostridiales bacterium]SCN22919.1 hypothetical protein N3C_1021 [Clostridium sp. N3C]